MKAIPKKWLAAVLLASCGGGSDSTGEEKEGCTTGADGTAGGDCTITAGGGTYTE